MAEGAIAFGSVVHAGEDPFDLEGDLLDGQFRVVKIVGEGDLSIVYRGIHEGVAAPIAVKCLNVPETLEASLVEPISESFREGARLHYRLAQGHLHIVQTLACGETIAPRTGQSIPYLVREWLEGRSLEADLAHRARTKQRPRSAAETIALLDSAADALAYAHREKVVHGSLNPKNLFVAKTRSEEVVKVLDFGLARRMHLASPGLSLLRSSYAAPEQLDRRLGATGTATDVFAFATVFLETMSGRPCFSPNAHASEVLRSARARDPIAIRAPGLDVPSALASVLMRALSPSPRERHADMRVFWAEVKGAAVSGTFAIRPSRKPAPPPVPSTRPAILEVPPEAILETEIVAISPDEHERDTLPGSEPIASVPAATEETGAWATYRATQPSLAMSSITFSQARRSHRIVAAVGVAVAAIALVLLAGAFAPSFSSTAPDARARRVVAHVPTALAGADVKNALRPPPPPTPEPIEPAWIATLGPRPFDPARMTRALDGVAKDLVQCTGPRSPRGPGSITVRIHPDGWITWLQIGPPYAGTATGQCIRNRFLSTRLPPFLGPMQALNYAFYTVPF